MCRNHSHIVADRIGVAWNTSLHLEIMRLPRQMVVQVPSGGEWILKSGSHLLVPALMQADYSALALALTGACFTCLSYSLGGVLTPTPETPSPLMRSSTNGQRILTVGDSSLMSEGDDDDVPF